MSWKERREEEKEEREARMNERKEMIMSPRWPLWSEGTSHHRGQRLSSTSEA